MAASSSAKGRPVARVAACAATRPPPSSSAMATIPSKMHQNARWAIGVSSLPPAVMGVDDQRSGVGGGDPAPQGFLGHLIAREYSQEECRNGEARSRCGGGGGSPEGDRRCCRERRGGRFSARRKRETVLRLLRGEDLESVSRELGITAARASQWRDQFLAAGQASLKSRAPDARDEANRRLQAKIGELLMENELLYAKVDQLEAGGPLARRRSRR